MSTAEILDWVTSVQPGLGSHTEVIADTSRGLVIRLTTNDGSVFFKADRILPPAEASIIIKLNPRWPKLVAPVLAVDLARGWTLTSDVGAGTLVGAPQSKWCLTATRIAAMQLDSGTSDEGWLALGTRDRRGHRLFPAIREMMSAAGAFLDDEVRAKLDAKMARIREDCDALAEDGIPTTLVHQDLVPVNIVIRDSDPVFLDWSDTVVGHPFFGFDRLLDACWTEPELKAAVIDAYLASFRQVAPADHLRESFDRVLRLRVVYEALRWHDELEELAPASERAAALREDQLLGLRLVAG